MQLPETRQPNRLAQLTFLPVLALLVLGLTPRLLELGTFLTPDEFHWVRRSRDFLIGVLQQDWGATLQTGHPGVTTMWTGSLGILYRYLVRPSTAPHDLLTFVQRVPSDPISAAYLVPVRLPTALLTALSLVVVFLLARRLFDQRVALVASCLLALNPFYLGLSRVLHHDALATMFMTLSLLPMIGTWVYGWKRRWLLISGLMAGLACLSKSSALLLMPFFAIGSLADILVGWRKGRRAGWPAIRELVLRAVLWGVPAGLMYVLAWPSMWVQPLVTLSTVFDFSAEQAAEAHVFGQYFLGHYVEDPGPLFYPVVWLLRSTPLNLLGLAMLFIWLARRDKSGAAMERRRVTSVYICLGYVLFFSAVMTWGAKKQDRYLLPIFPVLDLLAGLGLVILWQTLGRRWPRVRFFARSAWNYGALLAGVIVVQAALTLPNHPYYLTYYNPLLGGARTAQRLITVGWGEGLEQAAAYLDRKPEAENLEVTAWYDSAFAPYFKGHTKHFFTPGKQMSSDYVVFYENQLQRQMPDPYLLAYYQEHYKPEYVVHLVGLNYALVYAVPLERRTNWETSQVADKLILYGYRQADARTDALTLRLVWENRGMAGGDGLWAGLGPFRGWGQSAAAETVRWQPCRLAPGFSSREVQAVGSLAESECQLHTADLEAGVYSLHLGLGPGNGQSEMSVASGADQIVDLLAPLGELGISVPAGGVPELVTPREALDAAARQVLPGDALPLHVSYGDVIGLIGYQVVSPAGRPAEAATVRLYWQTLQDLPQPASLAGAFRLRFELQAPDGTLVASASENPFGTMDVGQRWPSGGVQPGSYTLPLPRELPPGQYHVLITLIHADGDGPVAALDALTGQLSEGPIQLEAAMVVP
jgi:4-amino-4-deoxy-L-arabinose transferase-like glycosyltransferase